LTWDVMGMEKHLQFYSRKCEISEPGQLSKLYHLLTETSNRTFGFSFFNL
jgi:hypothetical protein